MPTEALQWPSTGLFGRPPAEGDEPVKPVPFFEEAVRLFNCRRPFGQKILGARLGDFIEEIDRATLALHTDEPQEWLWGACGLLVLNVTLLVILRQFGRRGRLQNSEGYWINFAYVCAIERALVKITAGRGGNWADSAVKTQFSELAAMADGLYRTGKLLIEDFQRPSKRWLQEIYTRLEEFVCLETKVRKMVGLLSATQPGGEDESRLEVNVNAQTIVVHREGKDARRFEGVDREACLWVAVLAEAPGRYSSEDDVVSQCKELLGFRTSRIRAKLPRAIQVLIDSRSGKGSAVLFH